MCLELFLIYPRPYGAWNTIPEVTRLPYGEHRMYVPPTLNTKVLEGHLSTNTLQYFVLSMGTKVLVQRPYIQI